MESDDEAMEEPPADYFQQRRRSNTLPTEILRHLRDRRSQAKEAPNEEDESEDERDGEVGRNHRSGLSGRMKQLALSDSSSNDSLKVANKASKGKTKTSQSHRIQVSSYDDDPLSSKQTKHLTNHRLDVLTNNLMRAVSDDTLVVKKRRKPLPRGSNVYEKALEDFGHDEEDRDLVSPLPSPQILRRGRHSATKPVREDVAGTGVSSSPPRRVHWGQNVGSGAAKR